MKRKNRIFILATFVILLLSSCASEATSAVTPTLTSTNTLTPTFIPTNTITPTPTQIPTITSTPTPISGCSPRATVKGETKKSLPGFIDLVSVNTSLTELTATNQQFFRVVITVREIPDKIIVNQTALNSSQKEIELGVAIDTDNNTSTGGKIFVNNKFRYGYEAVLDIHNAREGLKEQSVDIQSYFTKRVYIYEYNGENLVGRARGSFEVDTSANTITLSAIINGVSAESYLHFFSYYDFKGMRYADELCSR